MTNPNRVPPGSPEGGQYAPGQSAETEGLSLQMEAHNILGTGMESHESYVDLDAPGADPTSTLDRAYWAQYGGTVRDHGEVRLSMPTNPDLDLEGHVKAMTSRLPQDPDHYEELRDALDSGAPGDYAVINSDSPAVEDFVKKAGVPVQRPMGDTLVVLANPMDAEIIDSEDELNFGRDDDPGISPSRDAVIVQESISGATYTLSRRRFEGEHPGSAERYYAEVAKRSGAQQVPQSMSLATRQLITTTAAAPTPEQETAIRQAVERDCVLESGGLDVIHSLEPSCPGIEEISPHDVSHVKADPSLALAKHAAAGDTARAQRTFSREVAQYSARRRYGAAPMQKLPSHLRQDAREDYPGIVESEADGVSVMALSARRNAKIPEAYRSQDGCYYGPAARSVVLRTFKPEADLYGDTRGIEHSIPRDPQEYRRRVERARMHVSSETA